MRQLAGTISSAMQVANELFSTPSSPDPVPSTFRQGMFPTKTRFLYLRSSSNQNKVTTIGYRFRDAGSVEYAIAKCLQEKEDNFFIKVGATKNDIFSKKVGRSIVEGRLAKYPPKVMKVEDKEQMYNRFIMRYHPDRSARRRARSAIFEGVFKEVEAIRPKIQPMFKD